VVVAGSKVVVVVGTPVVDDMVEVEVTAVVVEVTTVVVDVKIVVVEVRVVVVCIVVVDVGVVAAQAWQTYFLAALQISSLNNHGVLSATFREMDWERQIGSISSSWFGSFGYHPMLFGRDG